jgi:hypothetical protein
MHPSEAHTSICMWRIRGRHECGHAHQGRPMYTSCMLGAFSDWAGTPVNHNKCATTAFLHKAASQHPGGKGDPTNACRLAKVLDLSAALVISGRKVPYLPPTVPNTYVNRGASVPNHDVERTHPTRFAHHKRERLAPCCLPGLGAAGLCGPRVTDQASHHL